MPLKLNTSYGLPKSVLVMGGACAAVVALLVFFAFGRLGFNPTDEGFYLAISRRLLEGLVATSGFYNAASAVVRDFTRTDITGGRLHSVIIAFNCRIPNFHNGLAWRFTAKRRTGRTKIFGVLSGDVYHRIRYNRRLVALLGVVNIGRRVFINRGGVFCALKKCSPTSARILFDWRRLLDQTGLRIDHPDILVAVWRLAGLAFYCHFAFARRLICAVFACHGCIRRCLVSDGRPGRCICGTCRQEYFSNTVYCRF